MFSSKDKPIIQKTQMLEILYLELCDIDVVSSAHDIKQVLLKIDSQTQIV